MAGGLEMMMGIFFRSRQSKAIDPESMIWLERFAHKVFMRASLNSFLEEERSTTKSLKNKNKDLDGDSHQIHTTSESTKTQY